MESETKPYGPFPTQSGGQIERSKQQPALQTRSELEKQFACITDICVASFLTEDAAQFRANAGVALVGIGSLNIDDIQDERRPVHSILLGREIPIEHVTNLAAVPNEQFVFTAVPPKVKAVDKAGNSEQSGDRLRQGTQS